MINIDVNFQAMYKGYRKNAAKLIDFQPNLGNLPKVSCLRMGLEYSQLLTKIGA